MVSSGQRVARQPLRKLALAVASVGAWIGLSGVPLDAAARLPPATVALRELPFDAQSTYRLIQRGGPFPYTKDGSVFMNRERLLPSEPRGFYREYTVRTPGSVDRGARRIVCGERKPPKPEETCFYTSDHYNSFRRIVQ